MTTEIAHIEDTSLTVLPPQQPPTVAARQMLLAHAEMMDTAYQLAAKMVNTSMVPTRFLRKAEDATAAILYGAELGLNPIQSLQRIISIHGMPSLEARTMVALLKARGYRIQTIDQTDESVTVAGSSPTGESASSTWTIERATRAGYVPEIDPKTNKYKTNKNGNLLGNEKYITDPQAMLKAKAQAEVCRELAPDVLMGISYTVEELQSERFDDSALPPAPAAPRSSTPVSADEILGVVDPAPEPPAADPDPAPKATRTRKPKAQPTPKPEAQDAEVVDESPEDASENRPEPETPQVNASNPVENNAAPAPAPSTEPAAELSEQDALRKAARDQLTKAIFATFGEVGLGKDENREDRLIVIESIVGRKVASSKELDDAELQQLRNGLIDRKRDGVLEDDIHNWLNEAALREANEQDKAAAAAEADTTTEGK